MQGQKEEEEEVEDGTVSILTDLSGFSATQSLPLGTQSKSSPAPFQPSNIPLIETPLSQDSQLSPSQPESPDRSPHRLSASPQSPDPPISSQVLHINVADIPVPPEVITVLDN